MLSVTPNLGGTPCPQSPPNLGSEHPALSHHPRLVGVHLTSFQSPPRGHILSVTTQAWGHCAPSVTTQPRGHCATQPWGPPTSGYSQSLHNLGGAFTFRTTHLTPCVPAGTLMMQKPTRNSVTRPLGLRGERLQISATRPEPYALNLSGNSSQTRTSCHWAPPAGPWQWALDCGPGPPHFPLAS